MKQQNHQLSAQIPESSSREIFAPIDVNKVLLEQYLRRKSGPSPNESRGVD